MKNATLIIGPRGSGKTHAAKAAADYYSGPDGTVVWMEDPAKFKLHSFSQCRPHTKLIVVDEISADGLIKWYNLIHYGVQVYRPMDVPFMLYPAFLFTSSDEKARFKTELPEFQNLFHLIELE